jgi:hypothetical protein
MNLFGEAPDAIWATPTRITYDNPDWTRGEYYDEHGAAGMGLKYVRADLARSDYDAQALIGAAEFFESIATGSDPAPLAFAQAIRRAISSDLTASEAFAAWLNRGPKLAAAAGCYVGIKVTEAKPALPLHEGSGS